MTGEVLVFEVDDGTFAVPTTSVREVLRTAALFPLPESPELVEGGLNLRGEVVPVVDGRAILARNRKPMDLADHLIVLCDQAHCIAIHVDRAVALTVIDEETHPPEPGKFVACVVNSEFGPMSILDVGELIAVCHPAPSTTPSQESQHE